jgi:ligand-binding sensor domain-containing protein
MDSPVKYELYRDRLKRFAALLLFCFCVISTQASMQFFDYTNGLSNDKVNTICKDKDGLMWIGTEGGLNQFNGYEFVEIGFFKDHAIKAMYYDSLKNILWVGSNKGLFLFNVETHLVLDASARTQEPEVAGIGIWKQDIIVAFRNGDVLRFLPSGEVRRIFSLKHSIFSTDENIISEIAFDGKGYCYLLIHDGKTPVIVVNPDTGGYHDIPGLNEWTIWHISSGNGHCIMNADNEKIILYRESPRMSIGFFDVPEMKNDDPTRVIQEIDGEYYISFRESYAAFRLHYAAAKWSKVERTNLERILKSRDIRTFYRDNDYVLWIGTSKGLVKVSKDELYDFNSILSERGKTSSVRQIVAGEPGQLFIATYDGIYDYQQKNGEIKLLSNIPREAGFPLYARTLYYDDEYLYAGTESNSDYFYRYNLRTQHYERQFFTKDKGAQITSVFSIIMDENGIIWMATDVGLASFNPADKKITLHTSDRYSVGTRLLMYLQHSETPGRFWACGKGGAFLVDIHAGVQRTYDYASLLGAVDVEYLFVSEDAKHNLWLATQKYGIVMVPQSGEPVVINTSDGLASNEVYAVLWQNDQIAWISTSNGLSRYDIVTKTFNNYLYENGIADDEFNQHSFFRASDTLFYFGGINGITWFNPQRFSPGEHDGRIFLANITRWGTEDQKKLISFRTGDIVMNPTDYLITLNFGLSDYTNPSDNSYYYKINNLSNNWINLGPKNSLTLNGLAPGEYQIRVKGINKFGAQSVNQLSFSIVVKERYYKTTWFYVLVSILFLFLGYLYFRWRLNRITQRQLLRMQISSNLHDEVGSLLTQIVISTDNALYAIHDLEEKNKRLSKISTLSRNAINTMSDVLWSIDSRNDFVGNLTDRMREHGELMFAEKGVELSFEFTNSRVLKGIDSQVRQQLYLIFKEAIHNIIKHSKATQVKVTFKKEGKGYELTVSNNNHKEVISGQGKMLGQGIRNIHMRAKKINATCSINSNDDWFVVSIIKK